MAPYDLMAPMTSTAMRHRRALIRFASLAAVAGVSLLSGCATNYNSAGDRYYEFWPFIGSRNPESQLNYPAQNDRSLQLGTDPDPFYFMSPQPPFDWRVTSPYSQAPADPDTRLAAVGDNAACADRCESKESDVENRASLALRADAGDGQRSAER